MTLDWNDLLSTTRVTDGAWGTQLQAAGLPAGQAPELWNTENAAAVEAVAAAYVDAGSDIILSNTFGGNRITLAEQVEASVIPGLIEAGAVISKQAAGDRAMVFASMGPTGKIVMMGDVPAEEILAAFTEAAEALAAGGADAIVCESFLELDEAMLAAKAARSTGLPVVVSMTFAAGPDGTSTMMGNTPQDLARAAAEAGVDAVGANCGTGPEKYVRVAQMLREAGNLPVWIKANAGLPQIGADGHTVFPMDPDEFASYVPKLHDAGATFIGGCCGTTPRHIQAVRKAVDAL